MTYETTPYGVQVQEGMVYVHHWWSEIVESSGECAVITNVQRRYENRDSSIVVIVVFLPRDSTLSKGYLKKRYDANDMSVTIEDSREKQKLNKCKNRDRNVVALDDDPQLHRIFTFGPLVVSWPLPEEYTVDFDLITRDSTNGQELLREHVTTVVRKRTKSLFRDFWDGR